MRTLVLILALLFSTSATAEEFGATYLSASLTRNVADGKVFGVFGNWDILPFTYLGIDGGLHFPSNIGNSSPSFYIGPSLGIKLETGSVYGRFSNGIVGLVPGTDRMAAGFSILTKVAFGLKEEPAFLGLTLTHMSNGSFLKPNRGNTWIGVEFGVSFD